eukprot:2250936-Rhodomonas_salina.1
MRMVVPVFQLRDPYFKKCSATGTVGSYATATPCRVLTYAYAVVPGAHGGRSRYALPAYALATRCPVLSYAYGVVLGVSARFFLQCMDAFDQVPAYALAT